MGKLTEALKAVANERISRMQDMPEESIRPGAKIANLEIGEVSLSRFQPRHKMDPDKLKELIASIKEKGVIQPVLVRAKGQGYELIAGERRLRAAKRLGLTHLPAIVKEVGDEESLQLSLIENIQREDLNLLEEAQAYQRLISEFGYSQKLIAQIIGSNPSSISNTLRLLKLPPKIQAALSQDKISMGHARSILAIKDLKEQEGLFKRTVDEGLSVRELEQIIAKGSPRRVRHKRQPLSNCHLKALEERIQRILGTKVKIIAGPKRGRIILEYYSQNDLDRIIKLLEN